MELFKKAGIFAELSEINAADILIAGGYNQQIVDQSYITDDKIVMFVCGENISPSYNFHDCSLTCRSSSFCGKNIRLPQWYGDIKIVENRIFLSETNGSMPRHQCNRNLLFTAIYNNATPEREAMVATLRGIYVYENIHIFGSQIGKCVDKLEILSRSVVNLCFENSLGDGYVTENFCTQK